MLSYLNTAINMVSGMILSSVLIRALGDTQYGIYQTVASFANYLILLEFGMGSIMIRNISVCRSHVLDENELNRNASTIWGITVLLSAAIVMVSLVFYFLIPTIYARSMDSKQIQSAQKMFAVITGYLVCFFLVQTLNSLILAFENYTYKSVQSIARTIAKLALLLVLVHVWRNPILIALVDLVLSAVCLLISYLYCGRKIKVKLRLCLWDGRIAKTVAPLALAIFLQSVTNQVNNNADKFLIGILLTPEKVTLYSVPLYIYSIFSTLTSIPVSLYAPTVVQKVEQGIGGQELVTHISQPCRLTALTGGLVLFGFVAVGRQFVVLLYGETYLLAWPIAIILMLPVYINSVGGVLINVLDALNKRIVASVAVAISTVLNIVLTIFWLKIWGVVGAAVATALCTTAGQVLFLNWYYDSRLKIPMLCLFKNAFRGVLMPFAIGCVAAFFAAEMIKSALLSFLIGGLLFVGIAMGCYLLFGATAEEKKMLRRLLKRA